MNDLLIFTVTLICVMTLLPMAALRYHRRHRQAVAEQPASPRGLFDVGDEEMLAVLTAAASEVMSTPVAVRRIRFLGAQGPSPWAVTGRVNVMASHLISRRSSGS